MYVCGYGTTQPRAIGSEQNDLSPSTVERFWLLTIWTEVCGLLMWSSSFNSLDGSVHQL
jgi:hypothetical protein